MAVCKFFLQGNCRYGDNCWNEHPRSQSGYDLRQKLSFTPASNQGSSYQKGGTGNYRGNSGYQGGGGYGNQRFNKNQGFQQNRFQPLQDHGSSSSQGAQNTEYTSQQILQSMSQDMAEWTRSNMWPFSCFTFLKDMPSFPGFDDLSPEEVRLKAYEAEANGTAQNYRKWYSELLNEYTSKKDQIKNPTIPMKLKLVEAIESIQKVAKASEGTSSSGRSQGLFGQSSHSSSSLGSSVVSAPKGFFGGGAAGAPSSGSVFGGGASQQVSQSQGLFGNLSTNQNTGGGGVFGGGGATGAAQAVDLSKGLFGSISTNQNFGSAATTNQSVDQSKSPFGSVNTTTSQPSTMLFGANAQTTQPTALFGNQSTDRGLLGGGMQQTGGNRPGGPFGSLASTGSVFGGGGQATASTSGFSSTVTGGPATTGLFGKGTPAPQTSNSSFGQAPASSTPQAPSLAPSQSADSGASGGVQKSGMYTQMSELTSEEKTAFEAPKFVLGKIPTRPPPRELV